MAHCNARLSPRDRAELVEQGVDPACPRPSGPTSDRTTPTASGSTRCLGSLRIPITGVHTAPGGVTPASRL